VGVDFIHGFGVVVVDVDGSNVRVNVGRDSVVVAWIDFKIKAEDILFYIMTVVVGS
jgi:hypothetical protein